MKDEPGQGFTARASYCHSRAVLAGEVIMVNVNDDCIWVKASPSPLAVDASSVAMEMAPSVQLLLLIKIQVERDGERKARGQTQLMSQAAWEEGGCNVPVQLLREREGAGLSYSDGSNLGWEPPSHLPTMKSRLRKSPCHEELAFRVPIGMASTEAECLAPDISSPLPGRAR